MDINRELKSAIGTGTVAVGTKETLVAVKKGQAKLVIVTANCPPDTIATLGRAKVSVYRFDGTNMELGAACGKPFSISVLTIMEPGDSDILALQKEGAGEAAPKAAPKKVVKKKAVATEAEAPAEA